MGFREGELTVIEEVKDGVESVLDIWLAAGRQEDYYTWRQ